MRQSQSVDVATATASANTSLKQTALTLAVGKIPQSNKKYYYLWKELISIDIIVTQHSREVSICVRSDSSGGDTESLF